MFKTTKSNYISCESQLSEMYIRYRVCACVGLPVPRRILTLLHRPGCNLGNGRGNPLVMHYCTDLRSVHGFRCYDNSAEREMSASALYSLYALLALFSCI